MIFKSTHPLSPTVSIEVLGVPFDYLGVQQVALELSENKHDMATLVVTGLPPSGIIDMLNAPVTIDWQQGSQGHLFRGYVAHVSPSFRTDTGLKGESPFQIAEIVCFGASFVMKGKRNRLWENVSLEGIVQQLADIYKFSYDIPQDSFKFFRLIQSEQSDWEFLKRVVHDELGYSMTMHGTHLHVFDRMSAVRRNISFHRMIVPGRRTLEIDTNQILRMEATLGYVSPGANSNRDQIAVLDNRGQVSTLTYTTPTTGTGDPLPSLFTDEVSGTSLSVDYAQKTLVARSRNKFPFSATVEATGTPGVLPGGFVEINEFNTDFDGLWYVSDICQTVTRDRHQSKLSVIKDTVRGTVNPPPMSPFVEPPIPALRNNTWVASTLSGTIYA